MAKNKAKKSPPPCLARALTLLRFGHNWEQSWVAEASGRSLQTISDLERGRTLLERPDDLPSPIGWELSSALNASSRQARRSGAGFSKRP